MTQREIYNTFHSVYANDYKTKFEQPDTIISIENKIAKVTELLNYENFKNWLSCHQGALLLPEGLQLDYIHDPDENTTPEKTYLTKDYVTLIAYVLFIRAMAPLYLDYYNYVKKVTAHYYYRLFMLFVRSPIYTNPEAEKLRTYIEVNLQTFAGESKNDNLVLTAGLSDDDVLDLLIAEVIFNKLLTIDFFRKSCNIMSFAYNTIRFKGSFKVADGVNIRGKSVKEVNGKEDISYFEDHRKTSSVSIGVIVEIQHALSNLEHLIQGLGIVNFDYAQYEVELQNISKMLNANIDKRQIDLLGWFLSRVINPRALHYVEFRKLVELMLFAKVVLLQDGHTYMGMLMSSSKSNETSYLNIMISNTVSKKMLKRLLPYYGFVMEEEGVSVVEKTISEMSRSLSNSLWVPIGSHDQLAKVGTTRGFLSVPGNLNEVVFNFVAYVNGAKLAV